jgi:hypothetical protein
MGHKTIVSHKNSGCRYIELRIFRYKNIAVGSVLSNGYLLWFILFLFHFSFVAWISLKRTKESVITTYVCSFSQSQVTLLYGRLREI